MTDGSPAARETGATAENYGEQVYRFLELHAGLTLAIVLGIVGVLGLMLSGRKQLWYDELFTLIVAGQPTWHRLMSALPADGNPPLLHLLVRGAIAIFGQTALAARLPVLVAFLASCVLLYLLARRRCGVVGGLLAVALLLLQPGWSYAYEARPYALLLAFLLLGMLSWQTAVSEGGRYRTAALAGLAVAIAGSILSHNVGLIEVGFPLLLAEAVRFYRTRKADLAMYAVGMAAAVTALCVTLPMMHRTHDLLLVYAKTHEGGSVLQIVTGWVKNARRSFPLIVDLRSTLLIAVLGLAGLARERRRGQDRIPAEEWALGFGAALLIPVTFAVMEVGTRYYNCRYGIGTIAGIAMLGSFAISKFYEREKALSAALILFCVAAFAFDQVHEFRKMLPPGFDREPLLTRAEKNSELPIVISDPARYLTLWWYAPEAMRERLIYLADRDEALRSNSPIPELALTLEKSYIGARIEDYTAFLASHPHFLVYVTGEVPDPDLSARLREADYAVRLVDADSNKLYEAQRTGR